MNRNQEFDILKKELGITPPELEYTVTRARARIKHHRRRWVVLPAAIAAVFAAFVILVNTSTSFAYALADVPVLGDLAAALETSGFMGDLRSAVINQHAQVIGQRQTEDGLSVTVEYAVIDPWQINLFVRTENENHNYPYTRLELLPPEGTAHFVFNEDENNWMRRFVLTFPGGNLPQELSLQFLAWPETQADGNSSKEPIVFDFTIDINETAISPVRTVEIAQWFTAGEQQIWLDRLEITHAQTWLVMDGAEENSAWLEAIKVSLWDENGMYRGPVFTRSTDESGEHIISLGGSAWHTSSDQLQLHVQNTWWESKAATTVTIDTANKTAAGLPEWLTLEDVYWDEAASEGYYPGRPVYKSSATVLCFSCPAEMLKVTAKAGTSEPPRSPFTFHTNHWSGHTQIGSTTYFELSCSEENTVYCTFGAGTITLKLGSAFAYEHEQQPQISVPLR